MLIRCLSSDPFPVLGLGLGFTPAPSMEMGLTFCSSNLKESRHHREEDCEQRLLGTRTTYRN